MADTVAGPSKLLSSCVSEENMQQPPPDRASRSLRARRTQPALPGASSGASLLVPIQQNKDLSQPAGRKRSNTARRAVLKLSGLGVLLEILFLFFYPLLANATTKNDAVKQALIGVFPWVPHLYWTTLFPAIAQAINSVPLFRAAANPGPANAAPSGSANLLLVLLGVAFIVLLIAARIGSRVVKERLSPANIRLIFCTIIAFTAVYSLTFLFAPGGITQDVFLYGLYARIVTIYHVNPYVVSPAAFPSDLLHAVLAKGAQGTVPYGPVWLDISIPVVILARESVANILIGFRLIALSIHITNAVLIWVILAKLKPEARISSTLLYAWNPVVLLLGVCEMHYELVIILFVLLAALFFQRNSPIIGWIFMLVAALVNLLCLLLLPLFLRLLLREARTMRRGPRFLWWLVIIGISIGILALAYAPYWPGWGISGMIASIQRTFFPENAINSFDAALLHLPIPFLPAVAWLIAPQHWTIFAGMAVVGFLLLGFWLIDSLELVLLFSSWLFLALLLLLPTYWPWYALFPLALAVSSASRPTMILAMLLTVGAALSYYFWLLQGVWVGQALATLGLPALLWGWMLFFTSTWQMSHTDDAEPAKRFSRPSRPSRPPWSSRRA